MQSFCKVAFFILFILNWYGIFPLKLKNLLIILLVYIVFFEYSEAQVDNRLSLFTLYMTQNQKGDLLGAEQTLHLFLQSKVPLTSGQQIAGYNNLGIIYTMLGRYDKAFEYYNRAKELITLSNNKSSKEFADLCVNEAIILGYQKSYIQAIDFFEKGIRIYSQLDGEDVKSNLASAYLNLGIIYIGTERYDLALSNFNKSKEIKEKYKLGGLSLVYLNLAKAKVKVNKNDAINFFEKSISNFKKENGNGYFRMAEVYFDYGLLLKSEGKVKEAFDIHERALTICLKNYGEKHTLTSLSYKHLADDYLIQNKYDSALCFYQKSLISIVKNFNDLNIYSNPSIDSSLFDIRLLDNLKSKAQALDRYSDEQKDKALAQKTVRGSLSTIELALQLIDRIRADYLSEESRIYLAENEKETYIFATREAYKLYQMTHDYETGIKMYSIAQKAKAAILRNEITENELMYSSAIPDSLRDRQNKLSSEIAGYNNLIIEENRKLHPDNNKISLWKDALFDMNREKENISGRIEKAFPQLHDLIRKTEPVALNTIRSQLKKDEIIADYLLSNQYTNGKRQLFIFLVSHDSIRFTSQWMDSLFIRNATIIRQTSNPASSAEPGNVKFISFTNALNYMYLNLIKPVEGMLKGKKLIIIPDEEIGWLPFEAFIKSKPTSDQTDYEGLHYLIDEYTFSYGYSSSLLFNRSRSLKGAEVCCFSPNYENSQVSGMNILRGAENEIVSIYQGFRGKKFEGVNASKMNFLKEVKKPSILHLAMHSMPDSVNSKFSYLMFDSHSSSEKDSKLYNYEISLTRTQSPMIVLSACNSGSGTLYSGEGQMSLARGFFLAGASSVIKTSWEINDETSAAIMKYFYHYLAKGKEKNVAMRLAKLDYLKNSPPAFKNPYYWAAYEVLGDNRPVRWNSSVYLITVCTIMIMSAAVFFYFRRRKIVSDRA